MFYLKFMPWENVLDFLSKKKETELFLNNYMTYVNSVQLAPEYQQQNIAHLPIFDIDFKKVEAQGVDTLARFISLENKLKALDHQYHWSKDVKLNAQLNIAISKERKLPFIKEGILLVVALRWDCHYLSVVNQPKT